jgi:hypothetical protein
LKIQKTLIKIGIFGGGRRIRTFEGRSQRVYSPPHLTALVSLQITVAFIQISNPNKSAY